ncbi:MAG TPA: tRNA (adenosine(37)-N6)-threonylcarbamoyltransferase complex transferase subunit TsaD [Ohtaekwangia sp.]|nr:tRNA (adenosine(37)-N6)-threonylcarbamoyltransferase complex transferase subunit TsaD [Ohtaekwangia sp.]
MQPVLLAIESSCDETSASVISNGKVLNNIIASQAVHQIYGGVVPELASRAHQQNIVMVVRDAMDKASISPVHLDAIAVTRGPGLMGSLLVGLSFAKGMALALKVPLIEVNHMQAHILAHFIDDPKPDFPFLCLTVSGGHTQLVLVHDYLKMEVLGQTRDDAVGEAFDKAAKMMGLPYPGGPLIDRYAKDGNPSAFRFPVTSLDGLDFSFSGIKTALLYFLRDRLKESPHFVTDNLADICASLQHTLIVMLMDKLHQAVKETGIDRVAIAGGVSANSGLQNALRQAAAKHGWQVFIPALEYCTDNAAMIGIAAHYKYLQGHFTDLGITPMARMPLSL